MRAIFRPYWRPGPPEVQPQDSVLFFTNRTPYLTLLCAVTSTWCGVMERTTPSTTYISIKIVISLLSQTTILIAGTIFGETSTGRCKEYRERLPQIAASRSIRMINGGESGIPMVGFGVSIHIYVNGESNYEVAICIFQ